MKVGGALVLCAVLVALAAGQPQIPSNVVDLNSDNFDKQIASGTWLVKFYAPWCGHCKKLAPVWEEVATHFKRAKGPVQVAKVNCDDNSKVCSGADVSGYPTIKYYVDGIQKNYNGGRKKGDFISFIDKMSKPASSELKEADFAKVQKQENPAFLLVAEKPDPAVEAVFKKVATHLQDLSSPDFYLLKDRKAGNDIFKVGDLPENSIVVFREGDKLVYSGKPELDSFLPWAKDHQFPLLTEFSEGTYDTLSSVDKLLVMAVVDPKETKHQKFVKTLKEVAVKNSNNNKLIFVVLDGPQYGRWIGNYGLAPENMPTIIVLDMPNELHYFVPDAKYETKEKIENFLKEIEEGKVPSQTWSSQAYYTRKISKFTAPLVNWVQDNLVISIGIFLGLIVVLTYMCLATPKATKQD